MPYFLAPFIIILLGWLIHRSIDKHRHPERHSTHRTVELLLLWLLVFGGIWAIIGAFSHITGLSAAAAEAIGYTPSMFQWEVGWADITVGVLGIGCAYTAFRDNWMTAAVVALTISYGGDAVGHIMEYVAHNNTAPGNIWAIPSDIIQPLAAIILLIIYRRTTPKPLPHT